MENYSKNRAELINEMIEEKGHLFCRCCGRSDAFKFHCHHIFWKSEKPNHKYLHHKKNLIILRNDCHDDFHKDKSKRNYLIKERSLKKLFK